MSSATSPSAQVDAYIAGKPGFARPICEKLRAIVRKAAPKLDEGIKWGSPNYKGHGLVCSIGAFKEHVTLFFFRGAELENVDGLLQHGEGNASSRSVKFASLAEVKARPLTALVKQAAGLDSQGKVSAKKKAKRPALPVPPALASALRKNAKAKKYFASLPPFCRREYNEWIGTAKQEDTIQRRLEKAMVMLTEGRRMNEIYR